MRGAWYNEIDPYCGEWLRRLMAAGVIAAGDIDSRDIRDVSAADLVGYRQCHFFAGLGGWSYALRLAGVGDDAAVWTGSCPCQPFSVAGKGLGFDDERHLWPEWKRLIEECQPAIVFGEQVTGAAGWVRQVHGDLEALGYAVGGTPIEAASVGATHRRDRFWFVADAEWDKQPREESRRRPAGRVGREFQPVPWDGGWPAALARFRAMDGGLSRCVEATDAARNAIVPQVAAAFIQAYQEVRG
jgi:DNA (cytosine-5)-methyltransferase 1